MIVECQLVTDRPNGDYIDNSWTNSIWTSYIRSIHEPIIVDVQFIKSEFQDKLGIFGQSFMCNIIGPVNIGDIVSIPLIDREIYISKFIG